MRKMPVTETVAVLAMASLGNATEKEKNPILVAWPKERRRGTPAVTGVLFQQQLAILITAPLLK